MLVQPGRAGDSPMQTAMFCVCSNGVNLRMLTIEFRLGDLEEVATYFLSGLRAAKDLLHEPGKAGAAIDSMIFGFEGMLDRARKSNEENEPPPQKVVTKI